MTIEHVSVPTTLARVHFPTPLRRSEAAGGRTMLSVVGATLTAMSTTRAGLYLRLSKDPSGTKSNIAGQERRCRDLAEERGWEIGGVYVDRDRPATGSALHRPEYERMCSDIRRGRINAIVALDQDRLVREPYELELLLRLCEDAGVKHLLTSEAEILAEGTTRARIRASAAADEIDKMKIRHQRKQEDIAREGKWGGGFRAFGRWVSTMRRCALRR